MFEGAMKKQPFKDPPRQFVEHAGKVYSVREGVEPTREFWRGVGLSRIVVEGDQTLWYFGGEMVCGVDGDVRALRAAIRGWRRLRMLHRLSGTRTKWSGAADCSLVQSEDDVI